MQLSLPDFSSLQMPKADKYKSAVCLLLDTASNRFVFYREDNADKSTVRTESKEYKSKLYSPEFLAELTAAVNGYVTNDPAAKEGLVTLLVPNGAVAMDTINLPNINHRRNGDAFQATVTGLYKNRDDLCVVSHQAVQTKQMVTYSLAAMDNKLLDSLIAAMTEGGLPPLVVTFAANAAVNAVNEIANSLRNSSYLLLDIKENRADYTFVAKGHTTGFYSLPFGYAVMQKNKVHQEDMLFDHSTAELAVLNAKERAKAKQLTIMHPEEGEGEEKSEAENADAQFGEDENSTTDPTSTKERAAAVTIKTLPKKVPRKLPKFMQRPTPKTEEEFGYENFRVFLKWTLSLLEGNNKLIAQGAPEAVIVNMPQEYAYLFDIVNGEKDTNKIEFRPVPVSNGREDVLQNLEQYGGLYARMYNKSNNFLDNK